jgi:phospholipase C
MKFMEYARAAGRYTGLGAALFSTMVNLVAPPIMAAETHPASPIRHVIVIIGENRTFDHIFATYQPKKGESVDNLLSKGIINDDGTPGPHYWLAHQKSACDLGGGASCPNNGKQEDADGDKYELSPGGKALYPVLPAPLTGGPTDVCKNNGICSLADAQASENGLAPEYYQYLTSGGTGLASHTPDTRITNVNNLPPGPFQLTSSTFSYDAYAASPVHRFYQMWQQLDCSSRHAEFWNLSGCRADLFPWVEVTIGAGSNGLAQPANFSTEYSSTAKTTGEGSTSMGFYNMQQGDAPYLKLLADKYAMSDNYHQAVMGGTGANHVMLGSGDAIWFSDGNGKPAVTTRWFIPGRRVRARWMKSKIPILRPAPTTGTQKMGTAGALSDRPRMAAALTPIARIPVNRALLPSSATSAVCRGRSSPTASPDTTIC